MGRCGSRNCRRRTETRRSPRARVVGEVPPREKAEEKVVLLLRLSSWRKGSSLRWSGDGAGDEVREGGGRERERRMVKARVEVRSGREEAHGSAVMLGEAALSNWSCLELAQV